MADPVLSYQKLYQAAAAKYGVPASVLAGDVQVETGGNINSVSPAGAFGLTQFEPGTAKSYGVRPGDPTSEIMGQAHYLHDLGYSKNPQLALSKYNAGPGNPSAAGDYAAKVLAAARQYASLDKGGAISLGKVSPVNSNFTSPSGPPQPNIYDILGGLESARERLPGNENNPANFGIQSGWSTLSNILKSQQQPQTPQTIGVDQVNRVGTLGAVTTKGDVNPLQHFTLSRTDMGVDASAAPGTPILAPNDSRVVHIYPNWHSGQPYVLLQLLSGPNRGKYYYIAEQIDNLPQPGTVVKKSQPIATFAHSGTGIEMGWGTPSWQTLAQREDNTGDASHSNAPAGISFRTYLNSLGA